MRGPFRRGDERRKRRRANRSRGRPALRVNGGGLEQQARLTAARQFRIDFGEKFRIEQSAMPGAPAGIDAVALAERVKLAGEPG